MVLMQPGQSQDSPRLLSVGGRCSVTSRPSPPSRSALSCHCLARWQRRFLELCKEPALTGQPGEPWVTADAPWSRTGAWLDAWGQERREMPLQGACTLGAGGDSQLEKMTPRYLWASSRRGRC